MIKWTFSVSCGYCATIIQTCVRRHLIVREKSDISDNTASLFSGPWFSNDRIPIRTPRLENTDLQRELSTHNTEAGLHP